MYSLTKRYKDTEKSYREEHIAKSYKILKKSSFKSVR